MGRKFLLIAIIFTLFINGFLLAFGYIPKIEWKKVLGGSDDEECYSVCQTMDGGYVLVGYTYSSDGYVTDNHGDKDIWVVKLDNKGNVVWQRSLGGSLDDEAYDVIQTYDGGYLIVGITLSNDGDVRGNHKRDFSDGWVVKLDGYGSIMWQRCLGGSNNDFVYKVIQEEDGYLLIGGTWSNDGDVRGNHGDSSDGWVVKLDRYGNVMWQKCLGGKSNDEFYDVSKVEDGYILVGYAYSRDGDIRVNKGSEDLWVVKLSKYGEIVWTKTFGGSNNDVAEGIQSTKDGGCIIVGWTFSTDGDVSKNHGASDGWVIKLDKVGNLEWKKCLGGTEPDSFYSVQVLDDDKYVIVGETTSNDGDVKGNHSFCSDWWIVILNNEGKILWNKCFGGTDEDGALHVQKTKDKGFVVVGYSYSGDSDVDKNYGGEDFWIIKFK